jgi:hypothetical protein
MNPDRQSSVSEVRQDLVERRILDDHEQLMMPALRGVDNGAPIVEAQRLPLNDDGLADARALDWLNGWE